jgi:hypothetical protein
VEDSTYKAFLRNPNFLKTILPLSDELNQILGMIFERNPEDRITVSQLKRRIMECSVFCAPSVYTPPTSPSVFPSDASLSDSGSISSSEGSLTGSCSTLSDSDNDSDVDSGYESAEEQPKRLYEPVNPVAPPQPTPNVQLRPAVQAPFQPQPYVLPNPEYHGNPWAIPAKAVPNPYFHHTWGHPYEHQYEAFHATQQVHPVYSHAQPALHTSQYQFARDFW